LQGLLVLRVQLVKLDHKAQRVHKAQLVQIQPFQVQRGHKVQLGHKVLPEQILLLPVQRVQLDLKGQPVKLGQRVQQDLPDQPEPLVQLVQQAQPVQRVHRAQREHLQHSRRQYKTKLQITPCKQQINLRLSAQQDQLLQLQSPMF
jgi:hypothetical protein